MPFSDKIKNCGEKEYAQLLELSDIVYEYHPEFIPIPGYKKGYEPDFYLPFKNQFIEIISSPTACKRNMKKYKYIIEQGYNFSILNPDASIYISNHFVLIYNNKIKLPPVSASDIRFNIPFDKKLAFLYKSKANKSDMSTVLNKLVDLYLNNDKIAKLIN